LDAIGDGTTSKKRRRKRHKGLTLGIAGCVALAIGGGGAWAATSYLGTDGVDPQSLLPESTAAFATLNLDVSKEQQRQMLELVAKFPSAATGSDAPQEAVTQFLDMLEEHNGDIADGKFSDWVGPSASVAMWEHKGEPYGLATVSVLDEDAADEGLAALKQDGGADQVGYDIEDGHATIAFGEKGAQAAAKSAAAEAEKSPLSASSRYSKAKSFLGKDQVLTAWADLDQSYDILEKKLPDDADTSGLPVDLLKALKNHMHGQIALGAKARDYGIEAVSSTFGAKDVIEGKTGLMDKLSQMPKSDIAGALALPDDLKGTILEELAKSGVTGIGAGLDNAVMDKIFDLVSGAKGALSLSGVTGSSTPSGKAIIETTSADKAQTLKALADLVGQGTLETKVDGKTLTGNTVGSSDNGKITDNEYYSDAMGGATKKLDGAAFFDVQKLLQTAPANVKQALAAVKAAGVKIGTKNGEYVGNYRLIIA
jgi:hypothetical protein